MSNYNIACTAVTNTEDTALTSFVTLNNVVGTIYQIFDFSGCSNDQAFTAYLELDGVTVHRLQGIADTIAGRYFGPDGPVGETVTLRVEPAASGNATANLLYKLIK